MKRIKRDWSSNASHTIFLMTIGVLFAWSLAAAVVNTTMFSQDHLVGLVRMFIIIGVLRLIFSHRYIVWAGGVILLSAIIFIVVGFITHPDNVDIYAYYPYEPYVREHNLANSAADFIMRIIQYINGNEPHSIGIERAVVWSLSIATGLFVVIFGYVFFNFIVLFIVPAAIFGLLISSRFFSLNAAFYVFAFCSIAFLIKYLNFKCSRKSGKKSSFARYVMYITVFCIGLAVIIPAPSENFAHNVTQTTVARPFHFLNDTIYFAFGPRYFSLRHIGFGGAGGEGLLLGGNVTPNNRLIKRIRSDGPAPIYLAGSILDTYTGNFWGSSFTDREPVAFEYAHHFAELYERVMSPTAASFLQNENPLRPHEARAARYLGDFLHDYLVARYPRSLRNFRAITSETDGEISVSISVDVDGDTFFITPYGGDFNNLTVTNYWGGQLDAVSEEALLEISALISDFVYAMSIEPERIIVDVDLMQTFRTVDIDIMNYRTFSVFQTGVVQGVFSQNPNLRFFRNSNGQIVTNERLPRNTVYTILYSELIELTEPEFMQQDGYVLLEYYAEQSDEPSVIYDTWGRQILLQPSRSMRELSYRGVLRNIHYQLARYRQRHGQRMNNDIILRHNGFEISFENLLSDYLIPRADWIHDVYTRLPARFPTRVRELALLVTRDAENDYQRARMLEAYLRDNFEYTLEPGSPPPDVDFVYHFLFEVQRGYCTYFASAFVTMARSLGLPARYIEGFMVSGPPGADGFRSVLASMAHAWGEVYFEGYGWVRFEPTPAVGLPTALFLGYYEWDEEAWFMFEEDFYDYWWFREMYDDVGPRTLDITGAPVVEDVSVFMTVLQSRLFRYILFTIALIVLLAFVRVLWVYIKGRKALQKENNEAIVYSFGLLLKYMRLLDIEMRDNETAAEFASRISAGPGSIGESIFIKRVADIFAKARYSSHAASQQEREFVEDSVKMLDVRMRARIGKRRHLFYKYILAVV